MGKGTLRDVIRAIEQLPHEIDRTYPQLLRSMAKDVELEIKNRVLNQHGGVTGGIGVDDRPIKDNLPKTARYKERKGHTYRGQVKSLWDTGRMMGTVWQKKLSKIERTVRMGVPEDRKYIVDYLRSKGYDNWFGIPHTIAGILWDNYVVRRASFWIYGLLRRLLP